MTKQSIIEETAAYYNLGNRSVCPKKGGCLYLNPEGKMCAFGRCMTEEGLDAYKNSGDYVRALSVGDSVDHLLLADYKGHSVEFWTDIQMFHDMENHWTETGLSSKGEEFKKKLLKKYVD